MHSLDVGDTHGEVIGVANGLYGKLSDQIELSVVQIVHHLGYGPISSGIGGGGRYPNLLLLLVLNIFACVLEVLYYMICKLFLNHSFLIVLCEDVADVFRARRINIFL